MKYSIHTIIIILVSTQISFSQSLGDQLAANLNRNMSFYEIMRAVDSVYALAPQNVRDNGGDGLPKYKHWRRWAWYQQRRLDERGQFVNIGKRNLELAEEKQRAKSSRGSRSYIPGDWKPIGMEESSHSADSLINYTTGNTGNSYANGTGRIDRIAFHPTNPNTFYVGAPHGGVWKTTDGGQHWNCLTDTIPSIGVSGIVVSHSNANTIYILTGTGDDNLNSFGVAISLNNYCQGVMKSTDAGVSWAFVDTFPTTPGFNQLLGYDLVQNPTNGNILLAATNDGIFRTTNAGVSWSKVRNGLHYDLEFRPNNGNEIVATTDDSLFYSTNGGINWSGSSLNTAPAATPNRISISFSKSVTNRVYAFMGNAGVTGQFAGLYKSDNSGATFTRFATTPNVLGYEIIGDDNNSQSGYDLCVAVHPDSSNRVIISSINIWRSSDFGVTFTNNTGWFENQGAQAYVHCDHHALAYNALDDKLYACNDGGIWVSSNSGNTWTNISYGLQLSMFYNMAQYNTNTTYILSGGLQDNGVKYRPEGSKDYRHMYGADGFCTAFQPNNPNRFYSSINSDLRRINYVNGSTTSINPPGAGDFFKFVLTHPIDTNIVFCGTTSIFRSTNKGTNWTNVGGRGSWAMDISKVNPTIMYAAGGNSFWVGGGQVFRSSNTGQTWTQTTTGLPATINYVTDIVADPIDANYAFLTIGGFVNGVKVYGSFDAGASWSNISFNLPNVVVNSIAVTYSKIYVGTDISVYSMDFGGNTWTDIGDNIPHAPVIDLAVDEDKGIITAATFGRGIWQRHYCVNDISLLDSLKGKLEYESSNQITTSALIPGMNNIDSIFMTSGKVILQPGFRAKEGTHMKAAIGNCDNGPQPLQGGGNGTNNLVRRENGIVEKKE